jgi:hypothetical protein
MLSTTIEINGKMIGYIYMHNLGYVGGHLTKCKYEYEYYEVGSHKIKKGVVLHNRDEGATKLIEIVCGDLNK